MVVGKNFIEDATVENVNNDNYQCQATWYQFKIPINSEEKERIGNISDFRDITSMRLFLRGFNDSIVLRIAEMAVGSEEQFITEMSDKQLRDMFNLRE